MENTHPGKLKRRALSDLHVSMKSGWSHAEPGAEKVKEAFEAIPQVFEQSEMIWRTRTRTVHKVALPAEYGGMTVVFKDHRKAYSLRYALRLSKTATEAANYRVFAELGIPMAQLLFAGEERTYFRLKRTYLATRFADGYVDGRCFLPGGKLRGAPERNAFVEHTLKHAAKLHSLHCVHGGMRVYNFLWKPLGDGGADVILIDVASCRFLHVPRFIFSRYIVKDLANFFRGLALPEPELREALEAYCRFNPSCRLAPDKLLAAVNAAIARHR